MGEGIEQLIVSIVSLLISVSASLIAAVILKREKPLKDVLIISLFIFMVSMPLLYVTISDATIVKVPYIKDLSVADATSILYERHLKADFSEQYNDDMEKGRIIDQDLPPGLSVWRDTVVNLIVSKGPPFGVIVVESIPTDAEMYLDKTFQGQTPINVSCLSGRHMVEIRKSGYYDSSESITVIGNTKSHVYVQLEPVDPPTPECTSGEIYNASVRKLCSGYDMGIDDSQQIGNWLTDMGDNMRMTYPNGLEWGAVFTTIGKPRDPPRPFKDLSTFSKLSIDLRGEKGGEKIEIGIKDNTDPDDGSETKVPVYLTTEWQTYTFPISQFYTAEPTRLYVVAEFVFSGSNAKTIYFRNIKYLP